MSTTNTSFSTLISAIDTKAQSLASSTTDAKDLVYLGKAIEALNIPDTVSAVIDEGDTQVAAVNSAGTTQVAAVNSAGTTQVAAVNSAGTTQVAAIQSASSGLATTTYVDTEIASLVDSAPGTLDTLNELAAALGDDANFSTTVTNSIATKLPLAGGTMTGDLSMGDNVKAQFGAGNDLQIFHDGSASYIQGNSNLNITTANGVDFSITAVNNGAVSLYYDGSAKIATTSTGASVTGDLSVSGNVSGSYTNLHPVVNSHTNVNGASTFDMTKPMHHFTLSAAATFTAVSVSAGRTSMMVLDTSASAYTPSWNSDIKWPDATEPTWADYRYWIVSFTCLNGTTTLASASGYTV